MSPRVPEAANTGLGSLWLYRRPVWVDGQPAHPTTVRLVARRGETCRRGNVAMVWFDTYRERYTGGRWAFVLRSLQRREAAVEEFVRDYVPLSS